MKVTIRRGAVGASVALAVAAALTAFVVPQVSAAPPAAADDEVTAAPGELVTFNVLDNDSDSDGGNLELADVFVSAEGIQPDCEADGTCTYRAFDGPDYTDTFEYQLQDSDGEIDTGLVTVNVQGEPTDSPSTLSIKYKKGKFGGKIGSDDDACLGDRKVTVKKGKKKIVTDTTDARGKWSVKEPNAKPGKYKASVKAVTVVDVNVACGAASDSVNL